MSQIVRAAVKAKSIKFGTGNSGLNFVVISNLTLRRWALPVGARAVILKCNHEKQH